MATGEDGWGPLLVRRFVVLEKLPFAPLSCFILWNPHVRPARAVQTDSASVLIPLSLSAPRSPFVRRQPQSLLGGVSDLLV